MTPTNTEHSDRDCNCVTCTTMPTTELELLPCPFCGGEPARLEDERVFCGVAACAAFYVRFATVEQWNRRPASTSTNTTGASELRECPLTDGEWRHNNGFICNGTLRVLRASFDTNPSFEFVAEVLNWMVDKLNQHARRPPTVAARAAAEAIIKRLWLFPVMIYSEHERRVNDVAEIITGHSVDAAGERFLVHEPTMTVECNDSRCPVGSTMVGWPHSLEGSCMCGATTINSAAAMKAACVAKVQDVLSDFRSLSLADWLNKYKDENWETAVLTALQAVTLEEKPLESMTDNELKAAIDFHTAEANRYRNEGAKIGRLLARTESAPAPTLEGSRD